MTRALFFAVLLLLTAGARAESWRTYTNARFGVTAEIPADWRAGREPENGDGLHYVSPDGQGSITVSGGLHIWDTIAEAMQLHQRPHAGETIIYQHREARALVVSGTSGDRIFYRKSLLTCSDKIWNRIDIEYPAARKHDYDALAARVARSLRGGKSAQVEGCD